MKSPEFIDFDPREVPQILEPQKRNVFIEQAEAANPTIEALKREEKQIVQRIGAIKQLMARNEYPGKISDLADLENQREAVVKKINTHVDTKKGFDTPLTYGRKN